MTHGGDWGGCPACIDSFPCPDHDLRRSPEWSNPSRACIDCGAPVVIRPHHSRDEGDLALEPVDGLFMRVGGRRTHVVESPIEAYRLHICIPSSTGTDHG